MSNTAFSYKQGNSFMHRCPAWIKILVIPVVSIVVFNLTPVFAFGFFLAQMILAFALRFTVKEQLCDLRAVLYYAVLLIFAKLIGNVAANGFSDIPKSAASFITTEKETWALLLKLLCVMQSTSIIFKTSTSLQIREGLELIELAVRKFFRPRRCRTNANLDADALTPANSAPIAQAVSLFICFIPQVSKNWQQAERAWLARCGKKSLRMFIVLLPVFFSVGMKQAYNSARAISVRQ